MLLSEARIHELLERAQLGDEAAAASLVGGLRERVLRWALIVTGDPDDAEDVTQTVAVNLHSRLREFQAKSRFTTWLYTVVRHAAFDLKRRTRGRTFVGIDDEVTQQLSSRMEDHIERMSNEQTAAIVRAFFEQLPARQREVIELVDQAGYTPSEAAEVMGVEPETARVHLLRARRTLRSKLLEHHPGLFE